MDVTRFEPMLRDATIKAIDGVARKLTKSEAAAENAATRLLSRWTDMDQADKEHVVGIVIATATTAVAAIAAIRRKAKAPIRTAGKQLIKVVAKKAK